MFRNFLIFMFDYVLLIGGKKVSTQDHNEEY